VKDRFQGKALSGARRSSQWGGESVETEVKMPSISGYYTYKENTYGVIGECLIMLKGDRVAGVIYARQGELYVRSAKDFKAKFEKAIEKKR